MIFVPVDVVTRVESLRRLAGTLRALASRPRWMGLPARANSVTVAQLVQRAREAYAEDGVQLGPESQAIFDRVAELVPPRQRAYGAGRPKNPHKGATNYEVHRARRALPSDVAAERDRLAALLDRTGKPWGSTDEDAIVRVFDELVHEQGPGDNIIKRVIDTLDEQGYPKSRVVNDKTEVPPPYSRGTIERVLEKNGRSWR